MAKFDALKNDIIAWVEQNGLHPQPCGASKKALCEHFGIDQDTITHWLQKSDFSDAIKNANEHFASSTISEVANALKKAALGYEYEKEGAIGGPRIIKTFDPKTGKKIREEETGEIITKKRTRETINVAPNVAAGIFILTNIDPEHWQNKQNTDITSGGRTLAETYAERISPKAAKEMLADLEKKI